HEIVLRSHHPEIYDASLDDLRALRQRLREMRDKERTLARENRRAVRGKGPQRGASFPGTAEHPLQRKQVFAAALKRVSKEIGRMHKLEARTAHIEAARRALAMRRAAQFPTRPPTGDTSSEGMPALPSERGGTGVPLKKIGSVPKAKKKAKAGRAPPTSFAKCQKKNRNFFLRGSFPFPNFPGPVVRKSRQMRGTTELTPPLSVWVS